MPPAARGFSSWPVAGERSAKISMHSESACECLKQQQCADAGEAEVEVFQKIISAKAMIDCSAEENAEKRDRE